MHVLNNILEKNETRETHLMLNRSPIQILTSTRSPPPPIPCITRAVMSIPMFTLNAAIKLPARNTTLASINIGLRPKMSEILPHIGVDAAAPSRYPEPIHV
jgi:hypothetical protein